MPISRRPLMLGASAALLGGQARAAAPDKVRFICSGPSAAPYLSYLYGGIPCGLYDKLNLAPDISFIAGSAAAMQVLLSGDADIANLGLLDFIAAKKKMPNLPLHLMYSQDAVASYTLVVPEDSPIQSVADLKGKSIGVLSLASGSVPYTKTMLRQAGLAATDVDFVAVGADATAAVAVKSKRVDALNMYIGFIGAMEAKGMKFREFPVQVPSAVFLVNDRFLEANRDTTMRAFQGVVLSTAFSQVNPTATAREYFKLYGEPRGDATEATREAVHIIERTMAGQKQIADTSRLWGDISPASWERLVEFAGPDVGLAPGTPLSAYFDASLIPEINKVDVGWAISAAKAAG